MRENRPYGSEGGVAMSHPYPYRIGCSGFGRSCDRPDHSTNYSAAVASARTLTCVNAARKAATLTGLRSNPWPASRTCR